MVEALQPDICVIGAGAGGLALAFAAAALGVPVVLVEKDRPGGDFHTGSVPSKAFIAAARTADAMRRGRAFGLGKIKPEADFRRIRQHVAETVAALAPNYAAERLAALGVRLITAEGAFKDKSTFVAGDFEIKARRFVIATGTSPFIPHIPGLDSIGFFTTDTIFVNEQRPGHLAVIGGDPVGLELAQAHRRLGCGATVINPRIALGAEDPEMAAVVLRALRAQGIAILENAKIQGIEKRADETIHVHLAAGAGPRLVEATHVLIAGDRQPNVDGLGLDKAGIAFDRKGIKVSPKLVTSNRRVYAIGDVTGGRQSAQLATQQAGMLVRPLFLRRPAKIEVGKVPYLILTDPELAHAGLSEAQAEARHRRIKVYRWPYVENERAQGERRTEGHIKLVTDRDGKLLGATIAGANAGELISFWSLAIGKQMTLADVSSFMPAYPTFSEIGKRVTLAYALEAARKPATRALIRVLRWFG
ncbi:MAG TPA: FAD-dependent oxidoreductase [Rhizobiaceae bacterium]|nr:FAD-dependent oxidoreductase [Rhizobiaceae bacterium]